MANPTKEEAIQRMSIVAHVTSDGLATALLLLEHLRRGVYTVDEAYDHLVGNNEPS